MFALGQVSAAEKITYYHLDALGSPIAATDENGQLAWKEAYKPYGERIRKEDGGSNSTWYTGKQEDEDNGLTYFGARWYDPTVGRFMGVDPVGVQAENVHSFNRFAYANNNPYTFVDPDGRSPAFVDAYLVEKSQATAMGHDINTRAGAQVVLDLGVENATLQAEVISLMGGGALFARGLGSSANFAQKTFSETFSAGGKFAGRSINDVAGALRSSSMKASDVPIDFIIRNGNTLILNTRSAQALTRAGIPRSKWNAVNRTGQKDFEGRLSGQLRRNRLTDKGTSSVRSSN